MNIPFTNLKQEFKRVLLKWHMQEDKAEICAEIFACNSLDGVYSHGVNRFPVFVQYIREGLIDIDAEPQALKRSGGIEYWNGNNGIGPYNAQKAMERAVELAKENTIGCVALHNTNHWMRGGTYGRQAVDKGCIGVCFSNTIANMPPWGGTQPRIGNNPLVISIPYRKEPVVLDMAMSQFSYGKLQESVLKEKPLAVPGGFDGDGELTNDPAAILSSQRLLPIGFWKGSGLSLMLDLLLTSLTGGNSVSRISDGGKETGLSQFFLCIHQPHYYEELIQEIIEYTKTGSPNPAVLFPGESTLKIRSQNQKEGIPVHDSLWEEILRF